MMKLKRQYIELQKSIIEKEIPIISEILNEAFILDAPIVAVLRKGKEHFMCPKRYAEYLKRGNKKPVELEGIKLNEVVDLDTIALKDEIKEQICVKDSCYNCRYRASCKYKEHIDYCMGDQIDIQVTNHNLYLASMKNDYDILQKSTAVIVDEAHKFKDAAIDIFCTRISLSEIEAFASMIKSVCKEDVVMEMDGTLNDLLRLSREIFNSLSKYAVA